MSWYGGYGDWAPRVPVATKIARGRAAAAKLAKKEGRTPRPIVIDGRKIAKTFWGLKWCENLERYRDISNRLPRGATYVRNGSVADLVIEPGCVRAIVGGTEAYTVKLTIQTLKPTVWKALGRDCAQAIDSLFDLLQGRFNEGVMQRLTQAEGGLFPHKNEISMSCSCPDYAGVCKHIAATFYGVAARLDHQPELLFKLRNVDHLELIGQATNAANLDHALNGSSESALSGSDLGSIFGIDLESTEPKPRSSAKATSKRTPRSKIVVIESPAKVLAAKSSGKRSTRKTPTVQLTARPPKKSAAQTPPKAVIQKAVAKQAAKKSKTPTAKKKPQRLIAAAAKQSRPRSEKKNVA